MRREEYLTSSPEETKKIAEKLALTLHGGELILAYGDLGCGKTAFCQGIGKEVLQHRNSNIIPDMTANASTIVGENVISDFA